MDRRVKERLVGASILVVLIVLVAPELLSGPPPGPPLKPSVSAPEPVRNVVVDLAAGQAPEPVSEPADTETHGASEAHGVSETHGDAASAAAEPAQAPPRQAPAPVEPAPVERAAPVETAATPPISAATATKTPAGRGWAVQLGSFASHANADKLSRQLKTHGFPVYVLPGGSGSSVRYRVRVGPMADRGAATQAASKLKALGHVGSLVAP
jgi:DedD protein